jgi:glutathione reductase (NADPH)
MLRSSTKKTSTTIALKKDHGLNYDLIVIGGGSGGVRAARIAAGYGAKVALIEEYRLGGTCVIRGCVPKKLMVYASRFAIEFEESRGYGWIMDELRFDWATLVKNRDQEVDRLEKVYRGNLELKGMPVWLMPTRSLLMKKTSYPPRRF